MSGSISASTAIAIGAAVSAAGTVANLALGGAKTGSADTSALTKTAATSQAARSQLLATAGGAAGDPLQPGSVGGASGTLFGN